MSPLSSIKIIATTPDQWDVYRDIRLKSLQEEPHAFARSYEEECAFPQEKWIERAGNPYNLLAIEKGKVVGTVGAYITTEFGTKTAHIVGVFVVKEARGKGVGAKLFGAILKKIKSDSSIKRVSLDVNKRQIPALKLYEKFGFHTVGEDTQKMGDGTTHNIYLMELAL